MTWHVQQNHTRLQAGTRERTTELRSGPARARWLTLAALSGVLLSYVAIAPHVPALADDGTPLRIDDLPDVAAPAPAAVVGDASSAYGGDHERA